jgi:hypothetical protein
LARGRSTKQARNKRQRIYVRDGGICHYCGILCNKRLDGSSKRNDDDATLDHVQTRYAKGGNHDQNLVLACHKCNNIRSCIPYDVFVHRELWRPENQHKCDQIRRLFCMGAEAVINETKNVWLLEMYHELPDQPITVENWGIFSSADKVRDYMSRYFPDALPNDDDELGYIGYHFPDEHFLEGTSFVANSWDLQ